MITLIKGSKFISVMTLAALLAGAYQPASAQMVSTSNAKADISVDADSIFPAVVSAGHVLENTYLRQGYYNALSPALTFTGLDKVITINCPKGPCLISAVLAVQSGNATTLGNRVAIGFSVDGALVDPCFAVAGTTPVDGGYINTMQNCNVGSVTTGHHTLQIDYYSDNGAYVYEWAATYTLYKP
jgi:hypothetical protein